MSQLSLDQVAELLRQAGHLAPVPLTPTARQALPMLAVAGVKEHFQKQQGPSGETWPPLAHARPRGGTLALLDTGGLRASIQGRCDADAVVVSTNRPGAAVHQFGATIRPKQAKALAIPVTKQAVRSGSPRQFSGVLKWIPPKRRSGGNKGVLAEVKMTGRGKKKTKKITVHYVLKDSVTIPARPFLGFSESTVQAIAEVVLDEYTKAMSRRLGGS